ncbi:MAG: PQQ-binding-like beta-propeller repeat protein [Phycisphaerales bacterium]|nr:MAG: PQQ-binding-like beta-propeller repeat protein [Phycisphaerales bacterium]
MYRRAPLLALVLAMFFSLRSANADDWPTFMHDNHRSGVTGERLQPPLSQSWVFEAVRPPEPAWPPPAKQDYYHHHHNLRETVAYDRAFGVVGAGQTIFFGSSADDKVYALDARTGRTRWTFFTEGPVRFAPSVAGGKVYAGSDDGYAYCLSAPDGALLWKYRAAGHDRMIPGNQRMISMWPLRTGLLVDKGAVYLGAGLFPQQGTFLCALDAQNGAVTWKQQVEISPQGYTLASEERLYVPTGRASPAVFSRMDGRALGELPSAGGTFALLSENVLVAGPGRGSKELNAADIETKSKIAMFGGLRMLINGPAAYMQSETQLSAFDRRAYLKLSREQFSLAGQRDKLRERLKKMPQGATEAQEIQRQIKTLVSQIDQLSEKMKDCYLWKIACDYLYSMIMADKVLFAGGDNEIAAIEAGSGKTLWTAPVDGRAYGLSVINGALFASTDKGRIHCFRRGAQDQTKTITVETNDKPYPNDSLAKQYAYTAESLLQQTGIRKGFCLVLDSGRGQLAYELARRSDLKIIGVERDPGRAAAARQAIDKAGLYGRVVIHQRNSETLPYTKCFANLIVIDANKLPPSSDEIFRMLRPYGGVVAVMQPTGSFNQEELKKWGRPSLTDWISDNAGEFVLARAVRTTPKGAGEWTHIYAEPGNSACSGDMLVQGDMTVQWFGEPGPRDMIDRHHRNVPPLFKNGRLFVPGDCVVFVVDAYNGTVQCRIEVPNSRRLGAFLDAGSMAVDEKCLYVAAEDKCFGFDVRTGRRAVTYRVPPLIESEPRHWGYIAYSGNILFASAVRPGASYDQTSYEADEALWYRDMKVVVSDYLFALEKTSGRRLWTYQGGLILNTTLTIGGGRMYFVETTSPKALADTLGRMPVKTLFDGGDQYLVALDTQTGRTLFKNKLDVTNFEEPVYLNYAREMLLLSGSRLIDRSVRYYYRAFDAGSGRVRWDAAHDTDLAIDGAHGEYNRHPTIIEDTVYAWPCAYNLRTGTKVDEWKFDRHGHGCGGVTASARCLFWRGGNPWMYDLGPGGGPQRLNKVTRPGCWINIIPAGGLILVPESSSGCTCGFPLQTSMAFIPK